MIKELWERVKWIILICMQMLDGMDANDMRLFRKIENNTRGYRIRNELKITKLPTYLFKCLGVFGFSVHNLKIYDAHISMFREYLCILYGAIWMSFYIVMLLYL